MKITTTHKTDRAWGIAISLRNAQKTVDNLCSLAQEELYRLGYNTDSETDPERIDLGTYWTATTPNGDKIMDKQDDEFFDSFSTNEEATEAALLHYVELVGKQEMRKWSDLAEEGYSITQAREGGVYTLTKPCGTVHPRMLDRLEDVEHIAAICEAEQEIKMAEITKDETRENEETEQQHSPVATAN